MNILLRRCIAATIDYGIIAAYAVLLFLITGITASALGWKLSHEPFAGQLIGFITLTLPVVMYSYLTEKGKWKGTVGKKTQDIRVVTTGRKPARNILVRNVLKYLPWEMAHTGVHWTIYYSGIDVEVPLWTWIFLILPQAIVLLYFITILRSKGRGSVYDKMAKTEIIYASHH